jgi:hypothetical protein
LHFKKFGFWPTNFCILLKGSAVARMLEQVPENWCREHSSGPHTDCLCCISFNCACTRFRIREDTPQLLYVMVDCHEVISFLIVQVDLAHLLASRDQELRALSAEVIICTISSQAILELARQVPKDHGLLTICVNSLPFWLNWYYNSGSCKSLYRKHLLELSVFNTISKSSILKYYILTNLLFRWIKCTPSFSLLVAWLMIRTQRSNVFVWATIRYVLAISILQ